MTTRRIFMIAFPTTEVLLPDGSNLVIEQPQPAEKAARTVLDIQQSAMRSAYVGLPSCTVSGEERQITDADVLETYSSANPDEVADTKGVLVSEWHSEKCRRPTILLGKRYVSGQEVAMGM